MKIFATILAGSLLMAAPALAVDYLIGDNDGHGTSSCTIEQATEVTRFLDLAEGDRAFMCVTPGDANAAMQAMKDRPKSGGHAIPVPPAPKPTPVDPDPVDPVDPVDPEPDPEPVCYDVTTPSGHWEVTTETRTKRVYIPFIGWETIEYEVPVRVWVDTSTTEEVCE